MTKQRRPDIHCHACRRKAAVYMRHHKLALCGPHYLDWFVKRTQQTIEQLRMFPAEAHVLVAVSGGKDSLALWDVLHRLGYQADGLYIGLGIDGGIGYSDESLAAIRRFLAERPALRLQTVDLEKSYGQTIPQLALANQRGRGKPCSVCGLSKRYVMNRAALASGYDVLATGHNLDDEAAVLFQNTLQWESGYLDRQAPVLEANGEGLVRKVKPLVRLYEREVAAYALLRGIDYQYDECPHAAGAKTILYKELLNRLESESPGAKYRFYHQFLSARQRGDLSFEDSGRPALEPCQLCGQPTSADGLCAFCRVWKLEQDVPIIPLTPAARRERAEESQ